MGDSPSCVSLQRTVRVTHEWGRERANLQNCEIHLCKDAPADDVCSKQYEQRIREQVVLSGNPHLFPELNIPARAAETWIRRGLPKGVRLDDTLASAKLSCARASPSEKRVAVLTAVLRLVL